MVTFLKLEIVLGHGEGYMPVLILWYLLGSNILPMWRLREGLFEVKRWVLLSVSVGPLVLPNNC